VIPDGGKVGDPSTLVFLLIMGQNAHHGAVLTMGHHIK
jgi:hypothetical protein